MATSASASRAAPAIVRAARDRSITPRVRPRQGGLHALRLPEFDDADDTATQGMTPVPVTWGGHRVDAPGFDQDRFDRAMARAFIDDLRLRPLGGEAFLVYRTGATFGHRVTRATCTCPAGEHEVPCKHRALVVAHLDIRAPELARRWARRRARRDRERALLDAA